MARKHARAMTSASDEPVVPVDTERREPAGAWQDVVLSMYRIGTILLTGRRRILGLMFLGGLAAAAVTLARSPKYTASARFMPQAQQDASAGLKSIAGQFGLPLGNGNGGQSPEFYVDLLTSTPIVAAIARDSFALDSATQGPPVPMADLLEVRQGVREFRFEKAEEKLRGLIVATTDKATGVITVRVTTRWRQVSIAVVAKLVQAINDFNLRTRQSQAGAERRFTEGRMALAQRGLRNSEDDLQQFLERNRQLEAPRLKFEVERLNRDVSLHQQVVLSLAQSLDEARLREVRNIPVITIIQQPAAKVKADSRDVILLGVTGLLTGGVLGVLLAFFSDAARSSYASGQPDATSFSLALNDATGGVRRLWPRASRRAL